MLLIVQYGHLALAVVALIVLPNDHFLSLTLVFVFQRFRPIFRLLGKHFDDVSSVHLSAWLLSSFVPVVTHYADTFTYLNTLYKYNSCTYISKRHILYQCPEIRIHVARAWT